MRNKLSAFDPTDLQNKQKLAPKKMSERHRTEPSHNT